MPSAPPGEPEYACAIIGGADGRRLLQLRPADARHAPGLLTCFGGARDPSETAETCLRRELHEELGWHAGPLRPVCDLRQGARFIARFFHCTLPPGTRLRTEPGHVAVWAPAPSLPGLPLSPWHRAVLAAVDQGRRVVEVAP